MGLPRLYQNLPLIDSVTRLPAIDPACCCGDDPECGGCNWPTYSRTDRCYVTFEDDDSAGTDYDPDIGFADCDTCLIGTEFEVGNQGLVVGGCGWIINPNDPTSFDPIACRVPQTFLAFTNIRVRLLYPGSGSLSFAFVDLDYRCADGIQGGTWNWSIWDLAYPRDCTVPLHFEPPALEAHNCAGSTLPCDMSAIHAYVTF